MSGCSRRAWFCRRSRSFQQRPRSGCRSRRRGAIVVLALLVLVVLLGLLALAIDLGHILVARTELQRSADAAAMASAWELLDQQTRGQPDEERLRRVASHYAAMNKVCNQQPALDAPSTGDAAGDVFCGLKADPLDQHAPLASAALHESNGVRVRVVRSSQRNGDVSFFFGRLLGRSSQASEATGEAAFLRNFRGFRIPDSEPRTLPLLPFTLLESTWKGALEGAGPDELSWDDESKRVGGGRDGRPEIHLFPLHNNAPGNFGTLDIGNLSGNAALRRQILEGANQADLEPYGGQLALDSSGQLQLAGTPGLRATLRSELEAVIGQPRIIPIYRTVAGSGNNARYTIVAFGCVRIMSVKLTGGDKHVKIQPASLIVRGGIAGDPALATSEGIYSPVRLTR